LLGRYLDALPGVLRFEYSPHGKPEIAVAKEAGLAFNLSHAGDLGLLAVARKHAVGVDVEPVRPLPDADGIVHHYFSPREVAAYRILPACARERAFLGVWTRKEAFLKAHGMGLSLRLDQFDVSVDPDEAPRLLATRWDPGEASRWSLCCLDPYLGYVAAVAIRCPTPRLQCRILAGEAPGATTG
jgi:4'-phosphopantetheinyl transferase